MKTLVLALVVLAGCASTSSKDDSQIVDKAHKGCIKVASLSSEAFSIIPFLAPQMGKSMLKSKAKEYHANSVVIDKEEGFFHTKMSATGYKCL